MDPLRIAIVGSGPAGMYTADALRYQTDVPTEVDLIDRLPTPFGLLRYGVAPDHLKMKSLATPLQRVLDDPGVRFLGNVVVGSDVSVDELRQRYDAVIYTFGAAVDRRLGIEGEDLAGSTSSTQFVAWYSGHPDHTAAPVDLRGTAAAVIGAGNVAVDVARILSKSHTELEQTDIPPEALEALRTSNLTDVYFVARRGVVDARFTLKELKELGELPGVDVVVDPACLELDARGQHLVQSNPAIARTVDVFRSWVDRPLGGAQRRLHFRFGLRPAEVLGAESVEALSLERCVVAGDGTTLGTGEFERLPVDLVIRAVGYLGVGVEGVPLDDRTGTIPTDDSARVQRDGKTSVGEYAAGWAKRGATGVLGTNRADGQLVADTLLADLLDAPRRSGSGALELLLERGVDVVSSAGWQAIDAAEVELGASLGRPRTKVVDRIELLSIAGRGAQVRVSAES